MIFVKSCFQIHGHIQETEIEWKNRKRLRAGLEPLPPLYTAEEAAKSLEVFRGVEYDQIVDVAENIQIRFNDAGHMLRFCYSRNMGY